MNIVLAIGDLHMDKLTKYWEDANAMQVNHVKTVVSSGIRSGASHLVFLGDLADGVRDSTGNAMRLSENAQSLLLELFHWLDARIETDVILGNHDWSSEGNHSLGIFITMSKLGIFKRVRFHATPANRKIGTTKVAFLPFPHTTPAKGADLGFAHYAVHGSKGDTGRELYDTDSLHKFTTIMVQGHLHTPQKVRNHRYPGTLYQTSFGETDTKGYGLITCEGSKVTYEFVPVASPFRLINLRIYKREDFDQLTTDTKVLYKLFIHEDVKVPTNLLLNYPNIVNRLDFKTEEEADNLEQGALAADGEIEELDPNKMLPAYLKSTGADAALVDRALELNSQLLNAGVE